MQSQVNEVEAAASYMNAVTDLYFKDGSLLDRRGIRAPGGLK